MLNNLDEEFKNYRTVKKDVVYVKKEDSIIQKEECLQNEIKLDGKFIIRQIHIN